MSEVPLYSPQPTTPFWIRNTQRAREAGFVVCDGRMRRAPGPIGHPPSPRGRGGRIGKTDTKCGGKGQDRWERRGERDKKTRKGWEVEFESIRKMLV